MFHVQTLDPDCAADYYFRDRDLVVASFALTYHKCEGKITYRPESNGTEQVIYTNAAGVESHIAQVTDLTIHGVVRDKVEHF